VIPHPDEFKYWLALLRAPFVGAVTYARLLKHFGSPQAVFQAGLSEWKMLKLKPDTIKYLQQPDWVSVERDENWLAHPNNHLITFHHIDYPQRLKEIHDPPPVLFVRGDTLLLSSLQLAVVGSRNPSRIGEEIAAEFSEYLVTAGLTVTSGLAMGIDTACHQGALKGEGKTIAVCGTGLGRVYPAQNRELAHRIASTGALVSEFPPDTPAKAINFPRRNRIISGMSVGTLVVEAMLNSGALLTAQHAVEQGRDVFAIPGSIHNPLARGCHALIKQGAKLVETAADILEELCLYLPTTESRIQPSETIKTTTPDLDEDYKNVLTYMQSSPVSVDTLVELSGLTAAAISSMLLILELRGLVATQSGGLYVRIA
jgi:DNA processing protein